MRNVRNTNSLTNFCFSDQLEWLDRRALKSFSRLQREYFIYICTKRVLRSFILVFFSQKTTRVRLLCKQRRRVRLACAAVWLVDGGERRRNSTAMRTITGGGGDSFAFDGPRRRLRSRHLCGRSHNVKIVPSSDDKTVRKSICIRRTRHAQIRRPSLTMALARDFPKRDRSSLRFAPAVSCPLNEDQKITNKKTSCSSRIKS